MRIGEDVLGVLSRLEVDTETASVKIGDGQLDRKLYVSVNKVLEALGGKWNRGRKAPLFGVDPTAKIEHCLLTGTFVDPQKEEGVVPTPPLLAEEIGEAAGITVGMHVLEPSAGLGNLVFPCLIRGATVHFCEISNDRRASLFIALDRGSVIPSPVFNELIGSYRERAILEANDFWDMPLPTVGRPGKFDRVVMNPPFRKDVLGRGYLHHVLRAHAFLRQDGILVAVLPAGVRFRQDKWHKEFRAWYECLGGTLKDLPLGSFKDSGTSVSTVLLTVST